MRHILFIILVMLSAIMLSADEGDPETSIANISIENSTLKDAKLSLGSNYHKYYEPPAELTTCLWFDETGKLALRIQFVGGSTANTITLFSVPDYSPKYPGNAIVLNEITSIDKSSHVSTVPLAEVSTGHGLCLGVEKDKVIELYGPPDEESTHSNIEWIPPGLVEMRYFGETVCCMNIMISCKTNRVVLIEIHHTDW